MGFFSKVWKGVKKVGKSVLGGITGNIGSIIGAAGSIGAGIISQQGQQQTNADQKELAREQMAFQERMSSSAYQRSADDMEAAGLNRILALGSPASSPGGAMATLQNPGAQLAAGISAAPTSAQSALSQKQQRKLLSEQARAVQAVIDRDVSTAGINEEKRNTELSIQKQVRAQTLKILAETRNTSAMQARFSAEAQYYDTLGPYGIALEKMIPGVGVLLGRGKKGGKRTPVKK